MQKSLVAGLELGTQMRGHADHVRFVSLICASSSPESPIGAAKFSSTRDVAGIGSITVDRRSGHAGAR